MTSSGCRIVCATSLAQAPASTVSLGVSCSDAGRFFVAPPVLTLLRAVGLCSVEAGASLALVAPSNNAINRPLMVVCSAIFAT